MATMQLQRNPVNTVVFPPVVETQQQSLMLVKRLLAVAISSITYLRGLFPERAYGTKYVEDLCVKILKQDKSCPGSSQIVKWMLGCYDALQKKYLRTLVLTIFNDTDNSKVITECYQFRFKYTEEGPVVNFGRSFENTEARVTSADTKKACILLIRKLYVLMQNLGPLPSEISLTMKLFYYDEVSLCLVLALGLTETQFHLNNYAQVTPQDYQPPGFKEGENDDMVFEGIPVQLMVGDVSTPFHTVKLKITTESNRLENVMHSDLNTNESKHMMEPDKEEEFSTQDSNISIRQEQFPVTNKLNNNTTNKTACEKKDTDVTCEDEKMETDERSSPQPCYFQYSREEGSYEPVHDILVCQLGSNTSDLDVTGKRMRSGRVIYSSNLDQKERSRKFPNMKCKHPATENNKSISLYEELYSQEEGLIPKRQKISEPKDRF